MEEEKKEFQTALHEFQQAVAELQKPIMAYMEKQEHWERNKRAKAYLAASAREKAALEVVKDAVIVLGGGMVVLAAFAMLMLR